MTPREAAIAIYDEAGDTLDNVAEVMRTSGRPLSARVVAQRALIAHRACRAEFFDPKPLPTSTKPCCGACMVYMGVPAEYKPVPGLERLGFRRVV